MDLIRIRLLIIALIAFFSCAGLCTDLTATFNTQTPKFSGLYWQYWIYFGTFVLSILVTIILSIHLLYYGLLRHTHIICFIPLMLFFTTLASCIIFDDKTPWIDTKSDLQSAIMGGLFLHCALYNAGNDPDYPTLYRRCMLIDATWISGVMVCLLWLILFFILWFLCSSHFKSSPSHSTMQVYKYQLSDSHSKFSPPPSMTSQTSILIDNGFTNTNKANKTMHATGVAGQLNRHHLTYLPTKTLPPLNQRPSEDTLCLPIHSNTTTAIGSSYGGDGGGGGDSLLRGSLLQPHEEKVQVSDSWLQNFGPSMLDFTTTTAAATPSSSDSCSKNYTYCHSMDLNWMKRMNQPSGNTENDDDDDDDGDHNDGTDCAGLDGKDLRRVQQRDGGFIYPNSRRTAIAQSCPEFNNKKMKMVWKSSSNGADDTALRY